MDASLLVALITALGGVAIAALGGVIFGLGWHQDTQERILHDTDTPTLPVPVVLIPDMSLEPLALHTWTGDELN